MIEQEVKDTILQFKLFKQDEKIAVAASGGKDSTTLLYILKRLGYNITAMTVDASLLDYSKSNLRNLRRFCKQAGIRLIETSFKAEFGHTLMEIRELLRAKGLRYRSCTICGVLRRHIINKKAKELGFDKVATGHNMDDEAEAALMNIFRNDMLRFARLGPLVGTISSNLFVQRVKPLYFIRENTIEAYSKSMGFPVLYGRCPCATTAYRNYVRGFINELELEHPNITAHIINFSLKHKQQTIAKIGSCKVCGEPTNRELCKACQIIQAMGDTNARISG